MGVMVGDVRITLRDPSGSQPDVECEGLQKIYAFGGNIAAGFAGNIETGFRMVGDMAVMLKNSVPPDHLTTEPSRFLAKWARRARFHWAKTLTDEQRVGGCELLVMGALQPAGPFTRTVAYTLSAPEFALQAIPPRTAGSVGSGAHVPEYRAELERLGEDFNELVQFDTMYWQHGPAPMVGSVLSDAIEERVTPGISPHLHVCTVRFGEVEIVTNDRHALTPGVASRVMPPVAAGWEGWKTWKRQRGMASLLGVA